MDDITLTDVPSQIVLEIRKAGSYSDISDFIKQLCQYAESKQIQIVGAPIFICHEKNRDEAEKANANGTADVEVAIPIAALVDSTNEINCLELAGDKMAKIVHYGAYDLCKESYEDILAWIAENGYEITGPTREVYVNDPSIVTTAELQTEIYVPVR